MNKLLHKIKEAFKGWHIFYQYGRQTKTSFASKWYNLIAEIFNLKPNLEDIPCDKDEAKHRLRNTFAYLPKERQPKTKKEYKKIQTDWKRGRLWMTLFSNYQERRIAKRIWLPASILCISMLLIGQGFGLSQTKFNEYMVHRKEAQAKAYQKKLPELKKQWKKDALGYSANQCKDYLNKVADIEKPTDKQNDKMEVMGDACMDKYKDQWEKEADKMTKDECISFIDNIEPHNKRIMLSRYERVKSQCIGKYQEARDKAEKMQEQYRKNYLQ